MKILQATTWPLGTFIRIDALDECVAVHRARLLSLLEQILKRPPRTRIFITGRHHIRAEVKKRLSGRVMSVSLGPCGGDTVGCFHVRLDEDETRDAMDESLVIEILEKIPDNMSEMYAGQ